MPHVSNTVKHGGMPGILFSNKPLIFMKWQTSKVQISRSSYQNNIYFLRKLLGPNNKMSSVVKGNAYGHGIKTFVPLALECGIDHFSVFSVSEAYEVFQQTEEYKPTIMIMGMIEEEAMEWVIVNEIEFYVFDLDRLNSAIQTALAFKKKALVHLEVETGMNRTGLNEPEYLNALEIIERNRQAIDLKGVCTHFAGAESIANYLRIEHQKSKFLKMRELALNRKFKVDYFHSCCSAGAVRYPEMLHGFARIGIMQYGFWPSFETFIEYSSDEIDKTDPLSRIISWKSKIMDIKHVKRGQYIGYGSIYQAGSEMKIAIIPVGYGNGYSRSLSNIGRVLIGGVRTVITGKVNMNLISVDISHIPNVRKGDEVVLIGKQGEMEISVADFGDASKQINYELLTRLPQNLPREIVD